jgi:hypothetical protein
VGVSLIKIKGVTKNNNLSKGNFLHHSKKLRKTSFSLKLEFNSLKYFFSFV